MHVARLGDIRHGQASAIGQSEMATFSTGALHEELNSLFLVFLYPVEGHAILGVQLDTFENSLARVIGRDARLAEVDELRAQVADDVAG